MLLARLDSPLIMIEETTEQFLQRNGVTEIIDLEKEKLKKEIEEDWERMVPPFMD